MNSLRLSGIEICVFDAYGTLFDFRSAALACRDVLGDKTDNLNAIWRAKQLEYTWLRSLMGEYADFRQVTKEALDYSLKLCAIDAPGIAERLMGLYEKLSAYPEVPEMLAVLKKRGIKTAILSNGTPDLLMSTVGAAKLGDQLDAVLSVEAVKIYKPHPAVYGLVENRFAIKPEATCFVSSNAWDAHGGAAFGFQSVWANRLKQPAEVIPGPLAATLDDLSGLPGIIG
jgi:2-haloacid dehalogenase